MKSYDFDDDRVAETGRELARRDHAKGRPRPDGRFWAPAYREAYEAERGRLEREGHRRPAGVDPDALEKGHEAPETLDAIELLGQAVGRRVAWKLTEDRGADGSEARARFDRIADTVEAEIRSSWGPPRQDDVMLRIGYGEAVQAVTAIVEATTTGLAPAELETLCGLRRKFLLAIGLL